MGLYKHVSHPHKPINVNVEHAKKLQGFNAKIAVALTRIVGSMPTAYTFVVLAIVGLLAILGVLSPIVALLVAWTSQTLIQLVLLPVIMVGQNVLNQHQELQSQEQFDTTIKAEHNIEQLMAHLEAQDAELLKQTEMLMQLVSQKKTEGKKS